MREGLGRHDWDQTATLWVALVEPNRDRKKRSRPFSAQDIHPYVLRKPKKQPQPERARPEDLALLKQVFTRKKKHG